MPRARKHLVCVSETLYYHVTARCVRRAYLCGVDRYSGKSYEHRRAWVEDRLRTLSSVFSVSACAYAVMSNHYHLVVQLNPSESDHWTDETVLNRWTSLFRGPSLVQRHQAGEALSEIELDSLVSMISVYRHRLGSLSWFMKCLNEPIARQANAEDRCTGHFWESRFHSQALISNEAVIAAMAYFDLNPIRAGIARTPEASAYTNIRARLTAASNSKALSRSISESLKAGELRRFDVPIRPLLPFAEVANTRESPHLPIAKDDYLELLDATGRVEATGKKGRIDPSLEPILDRLGVSTDDCPLRKGGLNPLPRQQARRMKKQA